MNKKKTIAAIVILLISINYYSSGIVALAVQNDGVSKESSELSNNKEPGQYKNTKKIPENNNGQEDKKEIPEDNEQSGMKKLQIPQKMTVVVDPWELDGRGQIYSEQYAVRNTGDVAGIVTISGSICKSSRQDEIVVKSDREGLHENSVKSVYMEMEFSNGDKTTLSKEGSTYQAELGPGEELAIRFLGEVNENASKVWKDGDITIDAVYSWNVKEESTKTGNASQNILEDTVDESMEGQPGNDVKSEEETKIIDMQIPQSQDIAVDSWKIDENGKIISEQYIIRNAGEQPGTLVLSELVCKPGEQSEIAVRTEKRYAYNYQ